VSLVYVKNLIQQSLILAQSNSKETIFFGNDLYPYTMKEFCSEVGNYFGFNIPTLPYIIALFAAYTLGCFKLIGIKVPLYPFRLRNILMNYCYDISNSVKLGYLPEYTLHQAICETLDWYKANDNEFAK
jgi:nucleoside-diphosphate-sugar epimerase